MTIRFLETAEFELDEAVGWYEAQAPGLGEAFLIEALAAADRVERHPEAWRPLEEGIRRCRLTRFPYGLITPLRTTKSSSLQSLIGTGSRITGATARGGSRF